MKIASCILLVILYSVPALSCNSDYECGYGKHCVKPSGSISLTGTCVTPSDEFGNKDYSADSDWGSGYGAKKVKSCSFNTDCAIGFSCMKKSGELYGICVK